MGEKEPQPGCSQGELPRFPGHERELFFCPWVPYLPCLGAGVNMYLMAGLPATSAMRLVLWSLAGAVVYLSYGAWHSRAVPAGKHI